MENQTSIHMGASTGLGHLNRHLTEYTKVACLMKITSTKNQISNKFQHAAQAPALRVTQIQNSKRMHRQADKGLCSDTVQLR